MSATATERRWYLASVVKPITEYRHCWGRSTDSLCKRVPTMVSVSKFDVGDGEPMWFVAFNTRDLVIVSEEVAKRCLKATRKNGKLVPSQFGQQALDNFHWEMSR